MKRRGKRLDASSSDYEVEDATEELEVTVTPSLVLIAICGDSERCPIVLSAKDGGIFEMFVVHRSVSYGRYVGAVKDYRWKNPQGTRIFLENFDRYAGGVGTKKRAAWVEKNIPLEGLTFIFKPVSAHTRLDYFRSTSFKKKRKLSAAKNKGKKKRVYRLPDPKTLAGVRNRFGYHS